MKGIKFQKKRILNCTLILFILGQANDMSAQTEANGFSFNYFQAPIGGNSYGAGFSLYSAVWPVFERYPGAEDFQMGLPGTWLSIVREDDVPFFYTTIEGGLGWWGDTRFGTETPKFIMGGVALDFSRWANGVGAGSSATLANGQRDWNEQGGKYGAAQLSPNLLWPPDGLNMKQGSSGEILGYGYHPLPLTDVLQQTNGQNFTTGNQGWTLFLNSSNFKGPVAFFLPTHWTEPALDRPELEGLGLDQSSSDQNIAFAIEHSDSPAIIGEDTEGNKYARILPFAFPESSSNQSNLIQDIHVYSRGAKWDEVDAWFQGGIAPSSDFSVEGIRKIFFDTGGDVDGNIVARDGSGFEAQIDHSAYLEQFTSDDQTTAGFQWDPNKVEKVNGRFVMPEFYKLDQNNKWVAVSESEVPAETGLSDNSSFFNPRPDHIPYLTPKETDCHLQDPNSPWRSPGPEMGPFHVLLGDGSKLTYYWYKFIDQPAIIQANFTEEHRTKLQERIEKMHREWSPNTAYLPAPSAGELVPLDRGLIVEPPVGLEIGYVPIVTRQEKTEEIDLELSNLTTDSKESRPGGNIQVEVDAVFFGAKSSSEIGDAELSFFLTSTCQAAQNNVELFSEALQLDVYNCGINRSVMLQIPENTAPGKYKIFVKIDNKDEIDEMLEGNNTLCTDLEVIDPNLGLSNVNKNNQKVQIYPNPSDGIFHIATNDSDVTDIYLYDLQGKEIQHFTASEDGLSSIELQGAKGIYVLSLVDVSGSISNHRILKH